MLAGTFRYRSYLASLVVIFFCAALVGCAGAGQKPAHHRATTSRHFGPVPVSGRATQPVDVNAGGIEVKAGELEFGGGPRAKVASVTISHDDWNTIIATSRVPVDVGLMIDPGFNPDDLTHNRFQYLADRISLLGITKFDELGIIGSQVYGNYMLTTAIYNPTGQVDEITGLGVRITSAPPNTTIADHTFSWSSRGGCIIPAHTVYFAYLTFSKFTPMPHSAKTVSFAFSTIDLRTCPRQACPRGAPISLCQD